MDRYVTLATAKDSNGISDLFVKRSYEPTWTGTDGQVAAGPIADPILTSQSERPALEFFVAGGDGWTARGIWAMNIATGNGVTQRIEYSVDFLVLKGSWKIWHMHLYRGSAPPVYQYCHLPEEGQTDLKQRILSDEARRGPTDAGSGKSH
jgi:hypothetical protein